MAQAKDAGDVLVQETAPRERNQCADHPTCVGPVREEEEIGSRAGRSERAEDRVATPENRERIGNGDPLEPRVAKQPVRRLIERGAPRSKAWVESVSNHHAGNARPHRFAEGRQLSRNDVGTNMGRFVGRDPSSSQAGEVLHASARAQAAGERERERRPREMTRSQRPAAEVEDWRQVDVDPRAAESKPGRPSGPKRGPTIRKAGRGRPWRQLLEGRGRAALLVDEHQGSLRPPLPDAVVLHEYAGYAAWGR